MEVWPNRRQNKLSRKPEGAIEGTRGVVRSTNPFGPWYFDTCHSAAAATTVIRAYNEYEQHTEGHPAAKEKSFKVPLHG